MLSVIYNNPTTLVCVLFLPCHPYVVVQLQLLAFILNYFFRLSLKAQLHGNNFGANFFEKC